MFPCSQCGCCCKRVGLVIQNSGIDFPYKIKENGECEMLKDNKCTVYDNRPSICNIDDYIKTNHFNKKRYYKETIQECNRMMDEDGISNKYRIKL